MSGHSKWHSIKHKKAINDAKRAGAFTKLVKDVTVAAREGGDPETNFRLRLAVERAKAGNVPKDNIERAIQRGSGSSKDGQQLEEVTYEGYGPGQIALIIQALTDNKNRTLGLVKDILKKNGGKFVEGGGVSWQFDPVGSLFVGRARKEEEEMEMIIIESGAKDYREEDGDYIVYTLPDQLRKVKDELETRGIRIEKAELAFLAKNTVEIEEETQAQLALLLEKLDDLDDVTAVWDNVAI